MSTKHTPDRPDDPLTGLAHAFDACLVFWCCVALVLAALGYWGAP